MIYLTGDMHGEPNRIQQVASQAVALGVSGQDVLIQLGDFGYNFRALESSVTVRKHEAEQFTKLDNLPFQDILYIDGNHENFDRLYREYPTVTKYGALCHKVSNKVYRIFRGEVLVIQDRTFLALGGAPSIDKRWRLEGVDWWPEEEPTYDEMRKTLDNAMKLVSSGTDFYMLTHEIPDCTLRTYWPSLGAVDARMSSLKDFLDKVYAVAEGNIIQWYFAHFHVNCLFGNPETSKFVCLYEELIPLGYKGARLDRV